MTFNEYLQTKKIDAKRYRKAEPEQYEEFEAIFGQIHPESFTAQKLFLINGIRRRFPFKEEVKSAPKKAQAKPKIVPKPRTGTS
ncbi:MAG: hypothetical protein AAGA85_19890 [Bacteroidota bacterium]